MPFWLLQRLQSCSDDDESDLCTRIHRLRTWPELAPKAVAEGCTVGWGVCFYKPLAADFGPGTDALAEGVCWMGSSLLCASCRAPYAWLGGGGVGARSGREVSISAPLAADLVSCPEAPRR